MILPRFKLIGIILMVLISTAILTSFSYHQETQHLIINPLASKFWSNPNLALSQPCEEYFKKLPTLHDVPQLLEYEDQMLKSKRPLAFSFLVHKDLLVWELFLSLYFRPKDFYCIHIDSKVSEDLRKKVEDVMRCYGEKADHEQQMHVIPVEQSIDVVWGTNSILEADLVCLKALYEINKKMYESGKLAWWQHAVSLAGTEFPMSSYATFHNEITSKLGTNQSAAESSVMPSNNYYRVSDEQRKYCISCNDTQEEPWKFSLPNPYNTGENYTVTLYKGLRAVVLSHSQVEFLFNDQLAIQFYNFVKEMAHSEECYYATILRMQIDDEKNIIMDNESTSEEIQQGLSIRYDEWTDQFCKGDTIRALCNFATRDLPRLAKVDKFLILNKFNLNVDPVAPVLQYMRVVAKSIQDIKISNEQMQRLMSPIQDLLLNQTVSEAIEEEKE